MVADVRNGSLRAGPQPGALHGDFGSRHRGHQPDARFPGRRADIGARRIGGGRGDRSRCSPGCGRADELRDRWRSVRHLPGRQNRPAYRPQFQRIRGARDEYRSAEGLGLRQHAAKRNSVGHGARVCRGMVEAAPAIRQTALERPVSARDLFRRAWISGHRDHPRSLENGGQQADGEQGRLPAARRSAASGRSVSRSAIWSCAAADRERWSAAFYKGPITNAILKTGGRLGGKLAAVDFADFQAEWVQPVSTEYHGWQVYELPPNTQGIAALEMLNIFSQFPLHDYEPRGVEELHVKIEAQKLAYADLHRYVADPKFAKVPVDGLISLSYARERAGKIDKNKANCEVPPGKPVEIG